MKVMKTEMVRRACNDALRTIFLFRALHVSTQRAAFVPAMHCIDHRSVLHFL